MSQNFSTQVLQPRDNRFVSHALVEVRKFKSLSLFSKSAVLLDLSHGGFKLEYTADAVVHPGQVFWLHIPLSPLGISLPTKLICKVECRWFDTQKLRMGGVFMDISQPERMIIDQVIENLRSRGFLS